MIFRILEDQFAQKSRESKVADQRFMQLALTLGRRGLGRSWPNPAVGAVIVKDGVIIGRGWTQASGRPHAETEAIARAGAAAREATLYVTLEPCSHFGKTPPCADAIIAAGIARVVSAIEDPNPEVAGQGHARLRAAGIAVDIGLGAAEAARDHAGHLRRFRDKRPHVILKLAVSSDDKIAGADRKPVAITGEAAKARVHLLRAQCDAVLVGIGTVQADDPLLTCRLPGMEADSPVRVLLDRSLRISGTSRLVRSARETPVWVMTSTVAEAPAAARTRRRRRANNPRPNHFDKSAARPCGRAERLGGEGRHAASGGRWRTRRVFLCRRWTCRRILAAARPRRDRCRWPRGAGCNAASALTGSPALRQRASETLQEDTLTIYERA